MILASTVNNITDIYANSLLDDKAPAARIVGATEPQIAVLLKHINHSLNASLKAGTIKCGDITFFIPQSIIDADQKALAESLDI